MAFAARRPGALNRAIPHACVKSLVVVRRRRPAPGESFGTSEHARRERREHAQQRSKKRFRMAIPRRPSLGPFEAPRARARCRSSAIDCERSGSRSHAAHHGQLAVCRARSLDQPRLAKPRWAHVGRARRVPALPNLELGKEPSPAALRSRRARGAEGPGQSGCRRTEDRAASWRRTGSPQIS
jgi:hypothetical protein